MVDGTPIAVVIGILDGAVYAAIFPIELGGVGGTVGPATSVETAAEKVLRALVMPPTAGIALYSGG